jgi:hypothetical protein
MISGTIIAHSKRRDWAEQLSAQFDLPITWDESNDELDTHLRALESFNPDAQYHLTIEDVQNQPICFYYGQTRPYPEATKDALAQLDLYGANMIRMAGPLWGVCVAHPITHLPQLIESYKSDPARTSDIRLFKGYAKMGIRTLHPIPSPVDHRDLTPLAHARTRGQRTAYRYGETDWTQPLIVNYESAKLPIPEPSTPVPLTKITFTHKETGIVRQVDTGSNIERRMSENEMWVRT